MVRSILNTAAFGAAALLATAFVTAAQAQPKSRADCERDYKPSVGQSGKDVVWVPTPDELVRRMLTMAKVTDKDYVVDLGAGDGKIAIAAAKAPFSANSLGIEYNPDMVKLANCMVQVEGAASKTKVIQGDIFKEDFSKADVITMYLLPELNLCVRHRILGMKAGTRVTSHQFTMGDWKADETAEIEYRTAYLWIVPARVAGNWALRDAGGTQFNVSLNQTFQEVSGDVTQGSRKQPLVGASLRGTDLRFAFNDDKGATRTFTGSVRGNQVSGTLRGAGGETQVTGTLQGALRAAPWADMLDQCKRFYGK
ncbi:MAG: class I SAM-dependent methyltransferase [Burkholderiaceae bacterium]|nr:class I SAM-dependent methyltransferase [Burkholderiaceae bacterium]